MQTSNTKLNAEQKSIRKDLKFEAKSRGWTIAENGVTTLVYADKGNTMEFSISVTSPEESKFRHKVGEFYALCRFSDGKTVKMLVGDFWKMYALFMMVDAE